MRNQNTLLRETTIQGPGLHSGKNITMHLRPLPEDSGIIFQRIDLPGHPQVAARFTAVMNTRRCMTLGTETWKIATVEHLMAAFFALELDNVLIEIDGEEVPVGDGSSLFFMDQLYAAGIRPQPKPARPPIKIEEPLYVESIVRDHLHEAKSAIVVLPSDKLEITCTFSSSHPVVRSQNFYYQHSLANFTQEIAPARTIAFWEEIGHLRSQGLANCDDLDCAVIVGNDGYLNEFRYDDEIIRHKILDLLGDLALFSPIIGHIIAIRPGHSLHYQFLQKLASRYTS